MKRQLEHHAYINRSFDDICSILEASGPDLVESATREATDFAADLAHYLEKGLGFFDQDERVVATPGELRRSAKHATLPLEWHADPSKRVLPNVEATLELNPIISSGPSATCELALRGSYEPPPQRHRGVVEHVLTRRVADATLHTFLRHLAGGIERSLD